jgi:hypothetical protein
VINDGPTFIACWFSSPPKNEHVYTSRARHRRAIADIIHLFWCRGLYSQRRRIVVPVRTNATRRTPRPASASA